MMIDRPWLQLGFFTALCLGSIPIVSAQEKLPYQDSQLPLEKRVEDLLGRLTLEEKLSLVHGDSKFTSAAIPRLGIPRRWLSDGPHGIREDVGPDSWYSQNRSDDYVTCMPASIALAATWNPALAHEVGSTIGQEARARGKDIVLGPGVNILRSPLGGRNFEYFGEDPWLAGRIAVGYIQGEQSEDVASCVKHFAVNNTEYERTSINIEVSERTMQEIYFPAFRAAIQEGGVWTVMGAYNKFRGQFCCHNDYLLNQILKKDWGFQGLVVSDWGGTHNTDESALNGLDLEMGTDGPYDGYYLANPYREGLASGKFPMEGLDDKARRNLRVMLATKVLDQRKPGSMNTREHQDTARRVAEEGIVLLKNTDHALPLDTGKIQSIAVIGENATRLHCRGGDSSGVKPFYEINPLQGLVRRVGNQINLNYSIGYGRKAEDDATARAVKAAQSADVVLYFGGLNHDHFFDCEGQDRKDMLMPFQQDALLEKIIAANPRTIVVLYGTVMEMGPWLEKAPAVLLAWYPGMEGGNALAKVLFGDVNPSGKLPATFPKHLEDSPAHALKTYPGTNGTITYTEELLVGYRWFDTKKIEPLFPFGHGLSYASFTYSPLQITTAPEQGAVVELTLKNTGTRNGAEVAQLYVQPEKPRLPRPEKELKAFAKVSLKAGENQTVSLPLDRRAFAFYDPEKKKWCAEKGSYQILVGSSSRDIRVRGTFQLPETVEFD